MLHIQTPFSPSPVDIRVNNSQPHENCRIYASAAKRAAKSCIGTLSTIRKTRTFSASDLGGGAKFAAGTAAAATAGAGVGVAAAAGHIGTAAAAGVAVGTAGGAAGAAAGAALAAAAGTSAGLGAGGAAGAAAELEAFAAGAAFGAAFLGVSRAGRKQANICWIRDKGLELTKKRTR